MVHDKMLKKKRRRKTFSVIVSFLAAWTYLAIFSWPFFFFLSTRHFHPQNCSLTQCFFFLFFTAFCAKPWKLLWVKFPEHQQDLKYKSFSSIWCLTWTLTKALPPCLEGFVFFCIACLPHDCIFNCTTKCAVEYICAVDFVGQINASYT